MRTERDRVSAFSASALELYTALLATGETDISGSLLKATMTAAASVARIEQSDGPYLETGRSTEERRLCEELLKKSLFWICQVPDTVAQEHGGDVFREALRLLLWVRHSAPVELVAQETPAELNDEAVDVLGSPCYLIPKDISSYRNRMIRRIRWRQPRQS